MTKERKNAASEAKKTAQMFAKSLVGFKAKDPDGAPMDEENLFHILTGGIAADSNIGTSELRAACWEQYHNSPFVKTAVDDNAGAIAGEGFELSSPIIEIDDILFKMHEDFRNKLYHRWKTYIRHRSVTGEMYLIFTVHEDSEKFIEVDYVSSEKICGSGFEDGIIYHPDKTLMPLIYSIEQENGTYIQIPSINIAYAPNLLKIAKKSDHYNKKELKGSKSGNPDKLGGFKRFIVSWEGSLLTRRSSSYYRTVIIWSNLYTLLKMIEIDHKRAMATFAWIAQPADMEAWTLWCNLTEKQQKDSGLTGPKPPGSTLVSLPGWSVDCKSPQLPSIDGGDSDIQEFMVAGLNTPSDVVTGSSKGTYASVKESRGPWGDRIVSAQQDFRNFLTYDFGKAVLFIHQEVFGLKKVYMKKKAVGFDKKKKPIMKNRPQRINELITVTLPVFSSSGYGELVKALCGVKHNGLNQGLGIALETIAKKLGFANYEQMRLQAETENFHYPKLEQVTDQEKAQDDKLETPKNNNSEDD